MPVHVSATVAGFDALGARVTDATRQIVADAAHIIQAYAMQFAPVGVPGNSTNAPGDLRRSMVVEGPNYTGDTFIAFVGPTVIYARQRALGGTINAVNFPFMTFTVFGTTYRKTTVWQKAQPYMTPALVASIPEIKTIATELATAAIVTS